MIDVDDKVELMIICEKFHEQPYFPSVVIMENKIYMEYIEIVTQEDQRACVLDQHPIRKREEFQNREGGYPCPNWVPTIKVKGSLFFHIMYPFHSSNTYRIEYLIGITFVYIQALS